MAPVFAGLELVFNRYGLIDDEDLAIRVAERLTAGMISDHHSPFYPVRVWIQSLRV